MTDSTERSTSGLDAGDLLRSFGLVAFECTDEKLFRILDPIPEKFRLRFPSLCKEVDDIDLEDRFPFLEAFLETARRCWNKGSVTEERSGPWTENDESGEPCPLRAHALHLRGRALLVLQILGRDFEEMQSILQAAREHSLDYEQLARAQAALKKSERLLEQARDELEARVAERTETLRALADQLTIAEEKERRRVASHLHDHIGQVLAVTKIKLGMLGKNPPADIQPPLKEIKGFVDEAIGYTRSLTFELGSPVLYKYGLEAALESLLEHTAKQGAFEMSFSGDGCTKTLLEDVQIMIHQAAREVLHNIVKHAEARHVSIAVERGDDHVRVVIHDDGKGFDAAGTEFTVSDSGGYGLFNIRDRLDHLGGRCDIESSPGKGTTVTLVAPL